MRQLAAILFADMMGYTAMMQENEQLARSKRKRYKDVMEESVDKFNGRILQYYGDGSLSIFKSAIDSVSCAIHVQQQLQNLPKVEVRIGIHSGDVIIEDESIYGDGVNLASRIESLAVPGGIFISEKVFDEVKNQENILTRELGYFELKNVKQPVRVYAIANTGIVVPARDEVRGKTKQTANRLAVLPFVNMSADPDNEYFSDGVTEELLNALTKVDGLQVTSRTSAFAFKGKKDDIRDIAIQLNVDKVLEGSVRKAGNRVRITTQLINAADGYHIWSESYDRDLHDIFQVQDEISGIIANKLRENLIPSQKAEFRIKAPTQNLQAYTMFLKGLHYYNKLTPTDSRKAIECFEEAIALEPNYAQAYAIIAGIYSYLGATGQLLPSKAFPISQKYADKALALDDSVAESYVAKAGSYLFHEWKLNEAYECLQKALRLNPSLAEIYQLLGFYYILTGEKEKALEILEDAIKKDPLSPIINQSLGNAYFMAEQYDNVIRQMDRVLEINPTMRISLDLKGWAVGFKGDWEAALEIFKEVHRLTNHPLKGLTGLGVAYAKLGQRDKALECVRKLEERQIQEPDTIIDGDLVGLYLALGDLDKTFYHIDRCIDKGSLPPNYFTEYPIYKELRKDPRYQDLLRKAELRVRGQNA